MGFIIFHTRNKTVKALLLFNLVSCSSVALPSLAHRIKKNKQKVTSQRSFPKKEKLHTSAKKLNMTHVMDQYFYRDTIYNTLTTYCEYQ